ncbi:MAG: HAD family hydrolase, partial [Acaryochloridaceae cyanobacterium SU_2_1]|nr:HAD family hydrolase [Acaryochloridaceae cyanobacterium SU_2_1]
GLRQSLQPLPLRAEASQGTIDQFWQETSLTRGAAVLEHIHYFFQEYLGLTLPVCETQSELWTLCYQNFQAWYEGHKGFSLPQDETVVAVEKIQATLEQLQGAGQFILAIATGRPRNEVIDPLDKLGVLTYFDSQRIVTYDDVLAAESQLTAWQPPVKLGKPHPFVLMRALHLEVEPAVYCTESFQKLDRSYAAYVGDAASDIVAAKSCGCLAVGVLTGFIPSRTQEQQRQFFYELGCDLVIDSILDLPRALGMEEK